jgi:hypothetical protein
MKCVRKMSHLLSVLGVLLMVGVLFGGCAKLVVTLPNDGADAKPLDGSNRYVLHFNKGETPPTNATWSVSMRDYWPEEAVLDGSYKLPPVRKVM